MKRILFIACTLALLFCCGAARAEVVTGDCGENAHWSLDTGTGVLTISGSGAMEDYSQNDPGWSDYRDYITTVEIGSGVTTVGRDAFSNCTGLTSVTIPDSVVSVGSYAFSKCAALTGVTIPRSVNSIEYGAFNDCASLTHIEIPEGVTSLRKFTFYGCTGLISVTLPDSLTSINKSVFYGCTSLADISIPGRVTSIENSVFNGCSSLTSVIIPDSVTSIGYLVFNNCSNLTSVTILNPNCAIGDSSHDVFKNCSASLVIHGWAGSTAETYAGRAGHAFVTLGGGVDLILPASLTEIGEDAFRGISASSVRIPATVTRISGNPFAGSGVQFVYGVPGTEAEAFAARYGYTFMPAED